jgi:hypothetical protein
MNFIIKGIDIYIGRGPTRDDIVKALVAATPLKLEAVADYDNAAFADMIEFGKWAWLHSFQNGKRFSWKIDLELNKETNFEPVIEALQAMLKVEIAVPDETSPIPEHLISFSVDGKRRRATLPDDEFE